MNLNSYYTKHRDEVLKKQRQYYLEHKEQKKKYVLEHKEERQTYSKEYSRKHNILNNEKIKKYHKEYHQKNKLVHNAKMRAHVLKNKDRYLENSAKYYKNNKEVHLQRMKEYDKTLKGKAVRKAIDNNRRNVQRNSVLTTEIVQQVYENNIKKFGTLTCELCFKTIKFGQDNLEHLIPLARHKEFPGKDLNSLDNLGVAHGIKSIEKCNNYKHKKTLEEWFQLYPEYLQRKLI